MKNYKLIALYLGILVVLGACNAKKKVYEKYVKLEKDSISYVLESRTGITIQSLCDSITGLPKDFEKKVSTGSADVKLNIIDNVLTLEVLQGGYVKTEVSEKTEVSDKSVVKTKFKWAKITWFFLFYSILATAFIGIPKWINNKITMVVKLLV